MKHLKEIAIAILLLLSGTTFVWAQGAGIEWSVLSQTAEELYRQGKYDGAVVVAQKALEVAKQNVGPDHPDVAKSLNSLGRIYERQADFAKAEPLLKRSLAIREKALGPDHPDVAESLHSLGAIQRDYAKAESLYKRSLAIREKALGPDHPDVATSLVYLGGLYEGQRDYAKAESLYKRSLWPFGKKHLALTILLWASVFFVLQSSMRVNATTPRPSRSTSVRWPSGKKRLALTIPM